MRLRKKLLPDKFEYSHLPFARKCMDIVGRITVTCQSPVGVEGLTFANCLFRDAVGWVIMIYS